MLFRSSRVVAVDSREYFCINVHRMQFIVPFLRPCRGVVDRFFKNKTHSGWGRRTGAFDPRKKLLFQGRGLRL